MLSYEPGHDIIEALTRLIRGGRVENGGRAAGRLLPSSFAGLPRRTGISMDYARYGGAWSGNRGQET